MADGLRVTGGSAYGCRQESVDDVEFPGGWPPAFEREARRIASVYAVLNCYPTAKVLRAYYVQRFAQTFRDSRELVQDYTPFSRDSSQSLALWNCQPILSYWPEYAYSRKAAYQQAVSQGLPGQDSNLGNGIQSPESYR